MAYNPQYDPIPKGDLQEVTRFFNSWRMVEATEATLIEENLKTEHFLNSIAYKKLIRLICESISKYPQTFQLEERKRSIIRQIRKTLQLQGGTVDTEQLVFVGHVTPAANLSINNPGGIKLSPEDVEDNLEDWQDLIRERLFSDDEIAKPVRNPKLLIWLTWCSTPEQEDPFCSLNTSSKDHFCEMLGLPQDCRTMELVAMHFHCSFLEQEECFIFRPTLCDADLRVEFRPPPTKEKRYGLTWPGRLPEGVVKSKYILYKHLHQTQQLDTLGQETL